MFILGFHFPADMGNNVPDAAVVAKLDEANVDTSGINEIKMVTEYHGQVEELSYSKKDTFMFKALVHYVKTAETDYMIYTNRYQISELSKRLDSDDETMALCKKFDSMAHFKITAA
jgi:primosomal replication protein N